MSKHACVSQNIMDVVSTKFECCKHIYKCVKNNREVDDTKFRTLACITVCTCTITVYILHKHAERCVLDLYTFANVCIAICIIVTLRPYFY